MYSQTLKKKLWTLTLDWREKNNRNIEVNIKPVVIANKIHIPCE